jgi:hypothetical protein
MNIACMEPDAGAKDAALGLRVKVPAGHLGYK